MLNYLANIVKTIANSTCSTDFEEYKPKFYNTCNVPQSSSFLEDVIKEARKLGLKCKRTDECVTIKANKNTWVRFILYSEDEPYYGDKGDLNSIDVTKDVYDKLMEM